MLFRSSNPTALQLFKDSVFNALEDTTTDKERKVYLNFFKDPNNPKIDPINLANIVNKLCMQKENNEKKLKFTYKNKDKIKDKILAVAKNIYGAKDVIFSTLAEEKLMKINKDTYQVCIAKTPYSFSDNPNLLGNPQDFTINVTDIKVSEGAGFVVVYTNNIITLPGLTKIDYS